MSKIDMVNDTEFLNDLEAEMNDDNWDLTENKAITFRTTKSYVLDFFGTGGAYRSRSENAIITPFISAYNEDALLAIKAAFYFRDIRGGQGERRTFRTILKWLAENKPEAVRPNLHLISTYGRWDDLFVLLDTQLKRNVMDIIDTQIAVDIQSEHPSLLAKWLPSENTSSKKTQAIAHKVRRALEMSSKEYRKMLSSLRGRIGLVEQQISSNEWDEVQYDKLPSKAGLQYRKAFKRHDGERYNAFIQKVNSGEASVNAGTLYPYEIVEKILYNSETSLTFEAMWKNLPDYFDGTETSGIVVADTSGSMSGRPLAVSVSLAMYTAERNKGPYHNKFITFSEHPTLQEVNGETINDKVYNLRKSHWDMNTNVKAVFDLILDVAVKRKANQSELPTHLYIVSDMQMDACTGRNVNERLFQTIKREYTENGYKMPFLVFWNVNARYDNQPMTIDERGFQLVSGCSPSIFTSLLTNKLTSAYDLMLEVLNNKRYSDISIDQF